MKNLKIFPLTLFLAADDVLEEIYGDLLIIWEIDSGIHREEREAFSLRIVLSRKCLGGDHLLGLPLHRDLSSVVAVHR